MAQPNNVQTNVLDGLQQKSMLLLNIRASLIYISSMWVNEGLVNLTDADIQMLTTFTGVTATEALAAKGAIDAIVTAMGDPAVGGTNAYRLLKLANNIP